MAEFKRDSYISAMCHECEAITKKLWDTKRGEVRACCKKCADDYESGAGSED